VQPPGASRRASESWRGGPASAGLRTAQRCWDGI